MANVRGQAIDKTHLSVDNAEERGFIHRDYIAHCLRWTHVVKFLLQKHRYKESRILDIGCGKEFPLAKTMYTSKMSPLYYMGVDVNKLERPDMFAEKDWFHFESCDIAEVRPGYFEPFQVITCFEVLEHVEPAHTRAIVHAIHENLHEDGTAFVSTPVWDPHVGAAGNHVNEIKYEPLSLLFEDCDLHIEAAYGTFASQRDIEPLFQEYFGHHGWALYNDLKNYYDSNYLATIFAPLFPWKSRNVIWQLRRGYRDKPWLYESERHLKDYCPWTSSEKWRQLFPDWVPPAPEVKEKSEDQMQLELPND